MYKRFNSCIGWVIRDYTGGQPMGLKRTKKRKTTQPHTKFGNWGFRKITCKIDKAIEILEKRAK